MFKSNVNFWAEANTRTETPKAPPLVSGLQLEQPWKTQMVNLWKEIITRTFQVTSSQLSWEIQAICKTVPLTARDFHYKWHIGAGFPGCTKSRESDELHTSLVVALDTMSVFVVTQHSQKASRHQGKAASIPVAITVLLQDGNGSPRWCFPPWSPVGSKHRRGQE